MNGTSTNTNTNEIEIQVGQVWLCCDGHNSHVISVGSNRVEFAEDGDRSRTFNWRRDIFLRDHSLLAPAPAPAPAPASSQHPADLKPRGVKAPMYLIPWVAVPDRDKHRALRGTDLSPSAIFARLLDAYPRLLEDVARVFAYGAAKYARDNWQTFTWDDSARDEYFGAICRHLQAALWQDYDPESGLPHVAHAACGCLIMLWHEARS